MIVETMRNVHIHTRHGAVSLTMDASLRASPDPATLLIHGANGNAGDMLALGRRLPNPIYAHLPGHRAPTLTTPAFAGWVEAFAEALPLLERPLFLVGSSLGGLLALCLPYRALAIDPPLRTDNLWPVQLELQPNTLLDPIFAPGQDYRPLILGGDVLTGDVPLLPPRSLAAPPCLFESDISPATVRLHCTTGGHMLLQDQPEACLALARRLIGVD